MLFNVTYRSLVCLFDKHMYVCVIMVDTVWRQVSQAEIATWIKSYILNIYIFWSWTRMLRFSIFTTHSVQHVNIHSLALITKHSWGSAGTLVLLGDFDVTIELTLPLIWSHGDSDYKWIPSFMENSKDKTVLVSNLLHKVHKVEQIVK